MTIAATNSVVRIKSHPLGVTGSRPHPIDMSPSVYRNGRLNTAMNEPLFSVDEVAQPLSRPLDDLADPIVAIILRSALRCQGDLCAHRNRDRR
jgi:hypothetical protein